eukprot:jgi/Mesvir1/14167/Mv09631-RA.1
MAFDPGRVIKPQPVPEDLICIICTGVLVDPVEGPCEHLACRACLSDWLSRSTGCPVCRQPLGKSNIKQAHRLARNQLDALEVSCDNAARGCKAVVTLGSLKTHTSACGKAMERCRNTNCSATVLREDLPLHLQACPYRAVSCKFCDGRIQFQDQQDHLLHDCPDVELACDHQGGCGQRVKRCAMATHIDKECSKARVPCAILGCKAQVARGDMAHHLETYLAQHMACMSLAYSSKLQAANDEISVLKAEVAELKRGKVAFLDIKCAATLAGHTKSLVSLAISNGVLCSGSLDNTIRVWDLRRQECTEVLNIEAGKLVHSVEVDNGYIGCLTTHSPANQPGQVKLYLHSWSVATGYRLSVVVVPGSKPPTLSSLAVGGGFLYAGADDNTIKVLNTKSLQWVDTSMAHKSPVTSLLLHEGRLYSGSEDGEIKVWQVPTSQ